MTRVLVSVPYYRCREYVREAVHSVLAQTHHNLICVVTSDGDVPPWPELAGIDDPRLVRFSLPENRGCFFAHEVARRAVRAPFFAIQDADDTSHPERLERLLAAIGDKPGAGCQIGGDYNGKSHTRERRAVTRHFRHRLCHAALWRDDDLETIGGYYGGHRVGWDSLIVSAMSLLGDSRIGTDEAGGDPGEPLGWVDAPLYSVRRRPDSLTHSPETRKGSPYRDALSRRYAGKWTQMFLQRGPRVHSMIHRQMTNDISPEHAREIDEHASRLRQLL